MRAHCGAAEVVAARARARDYLLSVVELTTNRRWENRLPVERTARRPNDFSLRGFNGHSNGTSLPRDAN